MLVLAGQEEEDQARDQNPGELARRDQYHSTGGHSERSGGRLANSMFMFLLSVKMNGDVKLGLEYEQPHMSARDAATRLKLRLSALLVSLKKTNCPKLTAL